MKDSDKRIKDLESTVRQLHFSISLRNEKVKQAQELIDFCLDSGRFSKEELAKYFPKVSEVKKKLMGEKIKQSELSLIAGRSTINYDPSGITIIMLKVTNGIREEFVRIGEDHVDLIDGKYYLKKDFLEIIGQQISRMDELKRKYLGFAYEGQEVKVQEDDIVIKTIDGLTTLFQNGKIIAQQG